MINVLVIEDHPLMRTAICSTLETDPDIVVQGVGSSSQELFDFLRNYQVDVLLLDLYLPDTRGVDIIQTLRKRYPAMHILVFSSSTDTEDIYQSLQSGALGYLTKDAHSGEIFDAIHAVGQGKAYLPSEIADVLLKELQLKK